MVLWLVCAPCGICGLVLHQLSRPALVWYRRVTAHGQHDVESINLCDPPVLIEIPIFPPQYVTEVWYEMVVTRRGRAALVALPADLLAHVVRMSCSARLLILMQSVSRAWREAVLAVHEELWKLAVLTEFPRVRALLAASPQSDGVSFRDVYRSQLEAQSLPPQPVAWRRSPPEPTCQGTDFVFTFELKSGDHLSSWTGQLRWSHHNQTGKRWLALRMPRETSLWQAGTSCPLKTIVQQWMTDPDGAAELHLSMFVTWRMRTVRIVHKQKLAKYELINNSVWFKRAELPIKSDEPWGLSNNTPLHAARRHAEFGINVATGRLAMSWRIDQAAEQGSDQIQATPMTKREALVYLERCVPWPERLTPAMAPDFTHSRGCCCSPCISMRADGVGWPGSDSDSD